MPGAVALHDETAALLRDSGHATTGTHFPCVGAVREHQVHFHQLDPKGARIKHEKVSAKTGREVDADDIQLGPETAPGRYVKFDKAEIEQLRPASTRAIEIGDFVDLAEIDPIYYERTYWLSPVGGALAMSTMLFADEVVPSSDIEGIRRRAGTAKNDKEMKLARQIIEALDTKWKPEKYHDTYTEELREMIERKRKGKDIVVEEPAEEPDAEVVDRRRVGRSPLR